MNYNRLQRALAARIKKKAEGRADGNSSGTGASSGGGTGGSGGNGGGDGGNGGSGKPPAQRPFVFRITEGGVTRSMTEVSATHRESVEMQKTGIWYHYRKVVGSFDCHVWMSTRSDACLYWFANSLGTDEGGGIGYYDSCEISIDGGSFEDIHADQGGGQKHILLTGQCDTGMVREYTLRGDINEPDTKSWLGPLAIAEADRFITTVGEYEYFPVEDESGAIGGRQGVGYYYNWMRADPDALAWCRRRAEAMSRRHRVFRTVSSTGLPRFDLEPYSQVRQNVELRWNGSAWFQDIRHVPANYTGRFPTGLCPYEEDIGEWLSFDGQHQRRAWVFWEVLAIYDPRAQFMFKFAVNDAIMMYPPVKIPGEGTGTDYWHEQDPINNGINANIMSLPTFEEFCATDPIEFGEPGKGLFKTGREFAHAVACVAKWGTDDEKEPFRVFINKYFRKDPEVADPDGLGFLWRKRPGVHGGGNEGRGAWPSSLGSTATPANPSYTKIRETQFLVMNLGALGGCQECIDAYMEHLEPWPLQEFQTVDSDVGSTEDHWDSVAYPGTTHNPAGYKLGADYSLAFGNYHTTSGREQGDYPNASALYAKGVENSQDRGLYENILNECPTYMWESAV